MKWVSVGMVMIATQYGPSCDGYLEDDDTDELVVFEESPIEEVTHKDLDS